MPHTPLSQSSASSAGYGGARPKPVVTLVLVHGTFSLDADWVLDDTDPKSFRSKLRAALESDYEVHFDVIRWGYSGRLRRLRDNTDSRRRHGVVQVEQRLLAYEDVSAVNQRFIVAHSHGGNIVMSALRKPELRTKVTGVVCLSSPFLVHNLTSFRRELLGLSWLTLVVGVADSSPYAWVYAAFYTLIAWTIMLTFKQEKSIEAAIEQRRLLALAGKDQFPGGTTGPAFLAIRPRRDEVTILLWISRGFGALSRWLWNVLNSVGGSLVFVFISIGIIFDEFPSLATTSWLVAVKSFIGDTVLIPLMIGATVILSTMVVMRWSYGFDAVPWLATMDVRSRSTPWDDARVEVAPVLGLVKHTSVQNQSPAIIARWISQVFAAAPTPAG
jgi:Ca2+/Na+ antiporter